MDSNDIYALANHFNKLAQTATYETDEYAIQKVLHNAGLLGLANFPHPGEQPQLDYSSEVFTKYINPALDQAGTTSPISIDILVSPNMQVTLSVRGDTKVQAVLQRTLGAMMTRALMGAKLTPPSRQLKWSWIINYG